MIGLLVPEPGLAYYQKSYARKTFKWLSSLGSEMVHFHCSLRTTTTPSGPTGYASR